MPAHLVRAAGISRGEHVLDVACGTGIIAITACRAGAKVIGIDLTTELLGRAKEEAIKRIGIKPVNLLLRQNQLEFWTDEKICRQKCCRT
jgi:ubiquinone/menaquinone biosynthesis C-methylase UbiE